MNDQDAVARAPKFLFLYKRAGHRVIINHAGDMLVRPSFIETSVLKAPCGEVSTLSGMLCRSRRLEHVQKNTPELDSTDIRKI